MIPQLHPVGLPLHWDTRQTCGNCRFREWILRHEPAGDQKRPRCTYPRTTAPRVTYGPKIDILKTWPACIAHKPMEDFGTSGTTQPDD